MLLTQSLDSIRDAESSLMLALSSVHLPLDDGWVEEAENSSNTFIAWKTVC